MPIRESEKSRYPKDWPKISMRIRKRSEGRCECEGECGRVHECGGHDEGLCICDGRCFERHGRLAREFRGNVVLTVAHLDHRPENCDPSNLKAMCQRCHLRYDREHHMKNARATRERKKGPLLPGIES